MASTVALTPELLVSQILTVLVTVLIITLILVSMVHLVLVLVALPIMTGVMAAMVVVLVMAPVLPPPVVIAVDSTEVEDIEEDVGVGEGGGIVIVPSCISRLVFTLVSSTHSLHHRV